MRDWRGGRTPSPLFVLPTPYPKSATIWLQDRAMTYYYLLLYIIYPLWGIDLLICIVVILSY